MRHNKSKAKEKEARNRKLLSRGGKAKSKEDRDEVCCEAHENFLEVGARIHRFFRRVYMLSAEDARLVSDHLQAVLKIMSKTEGR